MNEELKKDGTLELEIRREFPFPRELVFEAWTNKDHLSKWMGANPDINLALTEVDATEGGKYRFGFNEKDCLDDICYVHGKYLEISRPKKLVFTWVSETPVEDANVETLVTVEFFETETGTEVLLTHRRFATEDSCEEHRLGWEGSFKKQLSFFKGKLT